MFALWYVLVSVLTLLMVVWALKESNKPEPIEKDLILTSIDVHSEHLSISD